MSRSLHLISGALTAVNDALTANDADVANCSEFGVYVAFDHTSAAGTVLIETAPQSSYTGLWAVLATITWAAIDKVHYAALTNVVGALRARVSSTVTSGTATVDIMGNMT